MTAVRDRLPTVDFIRGLCIILVVVHHLNLRIRFNKSALGAALPDVINRFLFWTGSYSVKVFFVVSGFLITSTILRRWGTLDRIDIRAFYRLRFARIAPCLLALLPVLSALHLAGVTGFTINPTRTSLARALFAALTFHVNWLEIKVGYLPGSWDILWSLAVEETFYLFYPVVCRLVTRWWMLASMAAGLVVAGPFFRTVLAPNEMATDYALFANLDCIAMGCVAAVLAGRLRLPGLATRIAGWTLIVLVTVARPIVAKLHLYPTGLDVTVLALGAALVLMTLGNGGTPSRWTTPIRWYGRNSYEIYLTHMFAVMFGFQAFTALHMPLDAAPMWFAVVLGVSGLLGHLVATFFSEPMNRWLRQA